MVGPHSPRGPGHHHHRVHSARLGPTRDHPSQAPQQDQPASTPAQPSPGTPNPPPNMSEFVAPVSSGTQPSAFVSQNLTVRHGLFRSDMSQPREMTALGGRVMTETERLASKGTPAERHRSAQEARAFFHRHRRPDNRGSQPLPRASLGEAFKAYEAIRASGEGARGVPLREANSLFCDVLDASANSLGRSLSATENNNDHRFVYELATYLGRGLEEEGNAQAESPPPNGPQEILANLHRRAATGAGPEREVVLAQRQTVERIRHTSLAGVFHDISEASFSRTQRRQEWPGLLEEARRAGYGDLIREAAPQVREEIRLLTREGQNAATAWENHLEAYRLTRGCRLVFENDRSLERTLNDCVRGLNRNVTALAPGAEAEAAERIVFARAARETIQAFESHYIGEGAPPTLPSSTLREQNAMIQECRPRALAELKRAASQIRAHAEVSPAARAQALYAVAVERTGLGDTAGGTRLVMEVRTMAETLFAKNSPTWIQRSDQLTQAYQIYRVIGDAEGTSRTVDSLRAALEPARQELHALTESPVRYRQVCHYLMQSHLIVGDVGGALGLSSAVLASLRAHPASHSSDQAWQLVQWSQQEQSLRGLEAARSQLENTQSQPAPRLDLARGALQEARRLGEEAGNALIGQTADFMLRVLNGEPEAELMRHAHQLRNLVRNSVSTQGLESESDERFIALGQALTGHYVHHTSATRALQTVAALDQLLQGHFRHRIEESARHGEEPVLRQQESRYRAQLMEVQGYLERGEASTTEGAFDVFGARHGEEAQQELLRALAQPFERRNLQGEAISNVTFLRRFLRNETLSDPSDRAIDRLHLANEMFLTASDQQASGAVAVILAGLEDLRISGEGHIPLRDTVRNLWNESRNPDDVEALMSHLDGAGGRTIAEQVAMYRQSMPYFESIHANAQHITSPTGMAILTASMFTAGLASELAMMGTAARLGVAGEGLAGSSALGVFARQQAVEGAGFLANWTAYNTTSLGLERVVTGRSHSWEEVQDRFQTSFFSLGGGHVAGSFLRGAPLLLRVPGSSFGMTVGESVGMAVGAVPDSNVPFEARLFGNTLAAIPAELGGWVGRQMTRVTIPARRENSIRETTSDQRVESPTKEHPEESLNFDERVESRTRKFWEHLRSGELGLQITSLLANDRAHDSNNQGLNLEMSRGHILETLIAKTTRWVRANVQALNAVSDRQLQNLLLSESIRLIDEHQNRISQENDIQPGIGDLTHNIAIMAENLEAGRLRLEVNGPHLRLVGDFGSLPRRDTRSLVARITGQGDQAPSARVRTRISPRQAADNEMHRAVGNFFMSIGANQGAYLEMRRAVQAAFVDESLAQLNSLSHRLWQTTRYALVACTRAGNDSSVEGGRLQALILRRAVLQARNSGEEIAPFDIYNALQDLNTNFQNGELSVIPANNRDGWRFSDEP